MNDSGRYYLDEAGVTDLDDCEAYWAAVQRALEQRRQLRQEHTDHPTVDR